MFPLQALPRCPEVDKPAASKAQDAKHAVLFPVVDGSATGAGGTVEQIGSFREKRQFDKLGFFHDVSEPVAEGLPCQSLRQSFHIYVVRLTYPFYRKFGYMGKFQRDAFKTSISHTSTSILPYRSIHDQLRNFLSGLITLLGNYPCLD